ncbi:hypothetical protein ACNVED_01875 [Legionella sp. D16C41]|uniref:hypothetical protein n=1 Tax=Legionella sp. D16C41 TaxID=3402688 RepID=UPI003AF87F8E
MTKKKNNNEPEKQFKNLKKQYQRDYDGLFDCRSAHAMQQLIKRHNRRIKSIGQDKLAPSQVLVINELKERYQALQENKKIELGIIALPQVAYNENLCAEIDNNQPTKSPSQQPIANVSEKPLPTQSPSKQFVPSLGLEQDTAKIAILAKNKRADLALQPILNESNERPANYEEMLAWLKTKGLTGNSLYQVLDRLHHGASHRWNPYWQNSQKKLNSILSALNNLEPTVSLAVEMGNKESELYQAVNMKRISCFTFFSGGCGADVSKSLQIVEDLSNNLQTSSILR